MNNFDFLANLHKKAELCAKKSDEMINFFVIPFFFAAGFLARKSNILPSNTPKKINQWILNIALPAVSMLYVPKIQFSVGVIFPLLLSPIILVFAFAFFFALKKFISIDRKLLACLILVCGLGNTSFVGFPITDAFYGAEGMKTAIMTDQGSFFALSFIGVPFAMIMSDGKIRIRAVLRRILFFPPFIAFVLSLILRDFFAPFIEQSESILRLIASTLSPAALFSVGFVLNLRVQNFHRTLVAAGLLCKLILSPLLILTLYLVFFGEIDLQGKVSVSQAAMPCMITASVIAGEYDLAPETAAFLAGVSILLAFPLIFLLNGIFLN